MHLETKLVVIKGAIRGRHRMAFSYGNAYREIDPQLLVSDQGEWQLVGVSVCDGAARGQSARPEWCRLSIEAIRGDLHVFPPR